VGTNGSGQIVDASSATLANNTSGTAAKATDLASYTSYSIFGAGNAAKVWITPTANGQCLMSGVSSYATTTPSFQSCPTGGSGTVNSGTGTHLAYYASSTTAVSDAGADFTFNGTHTWATDSTGIFDFSAAAGTANFKVPVHASNTATAAGVIDFDSTARHYHVYDTGADDILCTHNNGQCAGTVTVSGSPAQYDLPYWTSGTNLTKVTSPTVNGFYFNVFNPTLGTAVAPTAVASTALPAGTAIGSQDTGSPAVTFQSNGVKVGAGASAAAYVSGVIGLATGTASNTDTAGVITASGGTATYSFTGTYATAPVCVVMDDSTISNLLTKTVSTTTLTVTTTGATDSVSYICVGRN
jgi:hypothetical protein